MTAAPLSWALCTATLNRIDVLEESVRLAIAQTRPPLEIVICDTSETWEAHRDRIAALVPEGGPRLIYLSSEHPSSAVQRNVAIRAASADVLFVLDDDSLMYPDCADAIMAVYEDPAGADIVAVGAVGQQSLPEGAALATARKEKGGATAPARPGPAARLRSSGPARWIMREVFLMSAARNLVAYDDRPIESEPKGDIPADTEPATLLSGYRLTVRRTTALAEPYEEALLAYCPGEDLDACYRYGRHGRIVTARRARLHHFEAAAGRIKRRKATALGLLNVAYVTRRHSTDPARHERAWYVFALRRLLADALKDTASRRWDYPQLKGVVTALRHGRRVFREPEPTLRDWYVELQRKILKA
ncbi:glycosyl transferase family 2 [Palleronia aestuarii]|uniref:Glycosyl transferase family 2 n=1 Tax=Palleronia aestuarii TaxID=568105 RepID=A0A2W7NJJ1_9RHOB|nr:glycosyltransferase family 2 protein [Palleronia aestuarii]PZX18237.1 glycosyl transferase family 2 [Palleronia aestuarii]